MVFAIGDIHGRVDLLRQLEEMIKEEMARAPRCKHFVVYLGDYVDRGFESRQVLQHLVERPLIGCRRVCLLGNHDLWLFAFAEGRMGGDGWLEHGGDATLLSYGVKLDRMKPEEQRLAEARDQLATRLPGSHRSFLGNLELAFGLGDYFFCHAGVRPGVPLAQQSENDLLWIREPFLSHEGDLGKIIVHGHTVEEAPVVLPNRIGVDTGACWTGRLTCLVLEGTQRRFLATGRPVEV